MKRIVLTFGFFAAACAVPLLTGCFSFDVPRRTEGQYANRAEPIWEEDEQVARWVDRHQWEQVRIRGRVMVAVPLDDTPGHTAIQTGTGLGAPAGQQPSGETPAPVPAPSSAPSAPSAPAPAAPSPEPAAPPVPSTPTSGSRPFGPEEPRVALGPMEPAPEMIAYYFQPTERVIYFDMQGGATFRCERCGSEVDASATECPNCMLPFAPDAETQAASRDAHLHCPRCNMAVEPDATECPRCMLHLEPGMLVPPRLAPGEVVGPALPPGIGPSEVQPTEYLCPRCAEHTSLAATRCPRCDLVLRPSGGTLVAETYFCPRCGNQVGLDDEQCPVCDLTLQPEDMALMAGHLVCPRCDFEVEPGMEVCEQCGTHFLPGGIQLSRDFTASIDLPGMEAEGTASIVLSGPLCPRCGMTVEGEALACNYCGAVLSPPPYLVMRDLYCPRCGVPVAFDATSCPSCQVALVPPHMREEFQLEAERVVRVEPVLPVFPSEEDLWRHWQYVAGQLVCPRCETRVEESMTACPHCGLVIHPEEEVVSGPSGPLEPGVGPEEEEEAIEDITGGGRRINPVEFQDILVAQLSALRVFRTDAGEGIEGERGDGDVVALRGINPYTGRSLQEQIDVLLDSAEAQDIPYLLVPIVKMHEVGFSGVNPLWYPSLALWLAIWLPSEFIPGEDYTARTEILYRLYSVRRRQHIWEYTATGQETKSLNAWQRGWEIWGTVTVPLMPGTMLGDSNWDNMVPLTQRTMAETEVDFIQHFIRDAPSFDTNILHDVGDRARVRSRSFALIIGVGDFGSFSDREHETGWSQRSDAFPVGIVQNSFGEAGTGTRATVDATTLTQNLTAFGWTAGARGQGNELHFLQGVNATRTNVLREVNEWLYPRVFQDDQVLIYFAGYGFATSGVNADGDGYEKYLVTSDTEPGSFQGTALGLHELYDALNRLRSQRVAIVLDTSFYDPAHRVRNLQLNPDLGRTRERGFLNIYHRTLQGAFDDAGTGQNYLARYHAAGRALICAAGPNEVALEVRLPGSGGNIEGNGALTLYAFEAMRVGPDGQHLRGDADLDGRLSLREVIDYAQPRVTQFALRRSGLLQQVVALDADFLGDFYLNLTGAPETPAAPAAQPGANDSAMLTR